MRTSETLQDNGTPLQNQRPDLCYCVKPILLREQQKAVDGNFQSEKEMTDRRWQQITSKSLMRMVILTICRTSMAMHQQTQAFSVYLSYLSLRESFKE